MNSLSRLLAASRPSMFNTSRSFSSSAKPSKIRVMRSTSNDPFFNLATEDWIFNHLDPSIQTLFLWRNAPTVVIGRNQNPWKECHLQRMEEDNVHLTRRRSGGGAVYQDLGNTNFTFLSPLSGHDKKVNTGIITSALSDFGLKAEASGRNDILIDGKKVSGCAFKIAGDRAFHHGTLLINVDTQALAKYLNPNKAKLQSKGITSVAARVVNMQTLNTDISHETLCERVQERFFELYQNRCEVEELNTEELRRIPELDKYFQELQDWKWRFGETPDFTYSLETRFDWGIIDLNIKSEDGKITDVSIFSDCLYPSLIDYLKNGLLNGVTYDRKGVAAAMESTRALMASENAPAEFVPYTRQFEEWLLASM